jgi:hypothetical protein
MPKTRTTQQNKAFYALLAKRGFDAEAKAEFVFSVTNERTERSSEMTVDEMNFAIEKLGGSPITETSRADNYHRQKAGVKRSISATMVDLIHSLQRRKGMSDEGLTAICKRTIKKDFPSTTAEGNKIVEALKAMIRRDKLAAQNLKNTEGK